MTVELTNAPALPEPAGYSHASIGPPGGRVVHFAGQIGTDDGGNLVDDLAAQTELAFKNLLAAIDGAGAGPTDIAKLTVFIVGYDQSKMGEFLRGMGAATEAPLPQVPMTVIGCQSLFLDAALIEVEGVAILPA